MYNLLNKWQELLVTPEVSDHFPEGLSIFYQFRHLSGSCPDVHTYREDFLAVVDIKCGAEELTLLAGPNWLCINGKPVILASKEGTPFERMFDSDYEALFGASLANYMAKSDPDLDVDFANERCGVQFSGGAPIRVQTIMDTRH